MNNLKLWFLGPPRIEASGQPINVKRHKALALLAYLAVTGEAQSRDTLATLFWPDSTQSRARTSLRRDLSVLTKAVGADWFAIERDTIGLQPGKVWLDLAVFRQELAECQQHGHAAAAVCSACLSPLQEAADLYRDDFLTGFSLPDCPEFDEWQFFQMETLRQELASALTRLVQGFSTQGEFEAAIPYARRWVELDPLHEPAQRQLIALYGRTNQKSAAIRQYQKSAALLEEELGIAPASETTALFEQIRSVKTREHGEQESFTYHEPGPLHNIPMPGTPFVGRVEGLADIANRLADPDCRLLTLVGPGGIGKTRLALQAAQNLVDQDFQQGRFADGIYFVRLVALNSPDHLISTIASAINFSFYRESAPQEQLFNYLRHKKLLLVLDNFESLLLPEFESDGARIVAELLTAVPHSKLLITSREPLNLQEEWIYPVAGMRYPDNNTQTANLATYSAVQLFAQSARRVQPEFDLAAEQDCVLRICQLVEGMPLAIELAAAWRKTIACREIVAEIEHNLDFLATDLRDVPDRHRSMRVVFKHSWHILSPTEQAVLKRLSVFQGGLRPEAARAVADASLPTLAVLVEKSFLKVLDNGRYQIHQLLRQFAAEKLTKSPQEEAETMVRHGRYYIAFLQKQEQALKSKQQKTALAEIRPELGNIHTAWRYLAEQGDAAALAPSIPGLHDFYRISSRFQEGADTFRRAAKRLQAAGVPESNLVPLIVRQGSFYISLGMFGLAREMLQKGLSLARQQEAQWEIAASLDLLGNVFAVQGESEAAIPLYQESLAISRAIGNATGTAISLYNLGWAATGQGDYRAAARHFQESLTLYRSIEHHDGIAHALDSLGMTHFYLGGYTESEQYFQDSLTIFKDLGDKQGTARAIGGLGLVAWGEGGDHLPQAQLLLAESLAINRAIGHRLEVARRLGYLGAVANCRKDYTAAQTYLQEALAISRDIGHTFGISWALCELGTAVLGSGDKLAAWDYYAEALETAVQSQDIPVVLDTVIALAHLLEPERAVEMLTMVIQHPTTWQIMKDKAGRYLAKLESQLPSTDFAAAQKRSQTKSLEESVVEILTE